MFDNPVDLSIAIPMMGVVLMGLVLFIPRWFKTLSVIFAVYSLMVLYVTV
jgi:hypothetical protein